MDFYEKMKALNLVDKPIWTISTLQKEPLNPKPALAAHFDETTFHQWFALCNDPNNQLVTLTELYNEPLAPLNLCALRVDIDTQHIMLVDIESEYDKQVNNYLRKMPVVYGERSRHGGQHYIVPIPDNVYMDKKYHNLFIKSQIKFGKTKNKHSGVELFFHNHYLTFTQNQLPTKNSNTESDLRYFLDYLMNKVNTVMIKNKSFINNNTEIPTDALIIAKHAITTTGERDIKKFIKNNSTEDSSQREYQDIYVIARNMIRTEKSHYLAKPFSPNELINPSSAHDPKMLTWALLHLTYQYLTPREKWNQISSTNQTYIQYTCNKAVTYCLKNKK